MNDLSETDRCVKCGLCLPHCPTFTLTGNEADSPRGRISLMQSIAQPDVQYTAGLFRHLDQCLHCGACEAMCPSRVPFGRLMDTARVSIEPHRKRTIIGRLVRRAALQLIASPSWTKILADTLKIHRKLGLQRLIDRAPGVPLAVRRLNRLLPMPKNGHAPAPRPVAQKRGRVNLFRGCACSLFDEQTLNASRRLLEALGYRVDVPSQQGCCGALHQHNGDPATAARLADRNRKAFAANDEPVLVTVSGCTAHLADYKNLYQNEPAGGLADRIEDIVHFLRRQYRPELRFQPFEKKVAVYIPCTHRNVLRQQQDILDILAWIPGLEPLVINPNGGCCGAAGSYMLSQPELSERLREPLIDVVAQSGAALLLTTNIGCSIQFQAGLTARKLNVDVLHPVVLLDRLL